MSGVTIGEEEDLDSVDSNQLSPKNSNQDALEIIPVSSDNAQSSSDHVQSRRKSTPQQIIDSSLYQIPGISLHESDTENEKLKLSPIRNVSSPDESSSREFSFADALKLRSHDTSRGVKRKLSEEGSLRIRSAKTLLKSQDDEVNEAKETEKHRLSPIRSVSSPEESNSREFPFSDAPKLRSHDNRGVKRKLSEEGSLRIKSVKTLLNSQEDKSSEAKDDDVRLENQDMVVPSELLVRTRREREGREGVWARSFIARGVRYGPFAGKWASLPADARYAWEVCTNFSYSNLRTLLRTFRYM